MNPEHESTSFNDETPVRPTGLFGVLRSRYQVFIENYRGPASQDERARFGHKAINSVIFFVLLIAILMVFGIGLSWVSGGSQKGDESQMTQPGAKAESADTPAPLPAAPAQPAGPAGHAEVKAQSAPEKKTDGK